MAVCFQDMFGNFADLRASAMHEVSQPGEMRPPASSTLGPSEEKALLDENRLLFAQNNEKVTRTSTRSTIKGTAKVMTHDDVFAAKPGESWKCGRGLLKA